MHFFFPFSFKRKAVGLKNKGGVRPQMEKKAPQKKEKLSYQGKEPRGEKKFS